MWPVLLDSMSSTFYQAALKSQLLSKQDLEEAVRAISEGDSKGPTTKVKVSDDKVSDDKLADQLIKMGQVNRWQAEQLKLGRTRFHLKDYQIIDCIGQGGMGQVFKAEHSVMGRVVAIKVLPKSRSTDDAVANFQREIRTLANLDHPNLVRAFDAGHDGNVHFLVTEFVPGTDLRHLARHGGGMRPQDAAILIRDVACGLEHAHQRGLVHRDIKPGNIMVTPDREVKLLDLGLAGFLQEELDLYESRDKSSSKGRIVGTADYLAPEVIEGNPATPASDIYGLGCTLYYTVTRKVPFPGGSSVQKCHRHLSEQPVDPRRLGVELSTEFLETLSAMMAKDPQKRIQTAAEVIERLSAQAGGDLSVAVDSGTVVDNSRFARAAPPDGKERPSDSRIFPEMEPPTSGSGSLQGTDRSAGGSQTTTSVPPPLRGKRSKKSLIASVMGWVGALTEVQFYFLVAGFSLLIGGLLIILFSLSF